MKRLTAQMIEILMDCHEREVLHQEPINGTSRTQNKKLLLSRGLLEAKMYMSKVSGKPVMGFFITAAGKDYLKNLVSQSISDATGIKNAWTKLPRHNLEMKE